VELEQNITDDVLSEVRNLPQVVRANVLQF
jgi:hypothetical protein